MRTGRHKNHHVQKEASETCSQEAASESIATSSNRIFAVIVRVRRGRTGETLDSLQH